jgi:hypothetical protein
MAMGAFQIDTPGGTRGFFGRNSDRGKCKKYLILRGEPGWDRTIDHLIKSQVLYH